MQIDVKTAITIATALLAASGAWWASKGDISANSARIDALESDNDALHAEVEKSKADVVAKVDSLTCYVARKVVEEDLPNCPVSP